MNPNKIYLSLILLLNFSILAFGQDTTAVEKKEERTFTFSGSIDTYLHSSLGIDQDAPGTSFANLNGFSIGMVNLIGSYQGEKIGFTADLVFGPRGYDAVFGPAYSFSANHPSFGQRIINQIFATLKLSDAVALNLGQFNTFVGMETITPVPNFHYSTSYLFTNGPFNHTGLRADFTFGGGMVAKLAILNPTDLVEFNPAETYTLGGQIGYANDNGSAYLNLLFGDPDGNDDTTGPAGNLFQADITTGWNFGETFYLGLNGSFRTIPNEVDTDDDPQQFYGVALYPKLTLSEHFALGLRAEYFVVNNYVGYDTEVVNGYTGVTTPFGLDTNGKGSVTAITLSGNYTIGDLRIIPEIRLDSMAEDTYVKDSETGELTKSITTFNLAAVYKFSK